MSFVAELFESPRAPTQAEQARFRASQRLAFACAEETARALEPGVSEREVAARMDAWLRSRGVRDQFHAPFAWFGERKAFRGFSGFHPSFFPTRAKLGRGMPFILDCAPIYEGATADIGYAGSLGRNDEVERLLDLLAEHRRVILEGVRAGRTLRAVSREVDALCARQGVEPRHHAYPFSVLAHRVELLDDASSPRVARFSARGVASLAKDAIKGRLRARSPLWSSDARSEHVATPGLWAVEPHLGRGAVGAKFEELLVVTDDTAYWLDDDVPHVRRAHDASAPVMEA